MERQFNRIIIFNIVSLLIQVLYSMYLIRVVLILYRESSDQIMAWVAIPITSLILISAYASSSFDLNKGLFSRIKLKAAALLYLTFVLISDILIVHAFSSFHILGKVFFILVNIAGFEQMRRFVLVRYVK